jgi:hypothetical protein
VVVAETAGEGSLIRRFFWRPTGVVKVETEKEY